MVRGKEGSVEKKKSALTAPVPRQNARRGLRQLTNRNQTRKALTAQLQREPVDRGEEEEVWKKAKRTRSVSIHS